MTEGEKMVWAVAYVHALTSVEPKGMASTRSSATPWSTGPGSVCATPMGR